MSWRIPGGVRRPARQFLSIPCTGCSSLQTSRIVSLPLCCRAEQPLRNFPRSPRRLFRCVPGRVGRLGAPASPGQTSPNKQGRPPPLKPAHNQPPLRILVRPCGALAALTEPPTPGQGRRQSQKAADLARPPRLGPACPAPWMDGVRGSCQNEDASASALLAAPLFSVLRDCALFASLLLSHSPSEPRHAGRPPRPGQNGQARDRKDLF